MSDDTLAADLPVENATVTESPAPVELPAEATFKAHTLHNIVDEIEARWRR